MKLSVVIPAYNESDIVADTVAQLYSYLSTTYGEDFELIFCDDGSTDGTRAILDSLCPCHPLLRAVGYAQNRGKGAAVRTGMLAATGDFILFTDCDLAYGLDAIDALYRFYLAHPDADGVIGTRLGEDSLTSYSALRRFMSRAYRRTVGILTRTKFRDTQTGIKGFTRDTVGKIFPLCEIDRFAFDLEILLFCEHFEKHICEMPVKIIQNRTAQSKIHPLRDAWRMLRDVVRIRRRIRKISKK